MAKSRRPSSRKSKPASRASKAASGARSARPKRSRQPTPRRAVALKPIRQSIIVAIDGLQRLEPTDAIKLTLERLTRCVAEFDAICDPQNLDGCGPNMDFPVS